MRRLPAILIVLVCLVLLSRAEAPLPLVRVIATGGTISNQAGDRLTAAELLDGVPEAGRYIRTEAEQFSNLGSASMTLAQWLQLSRRINHLYRERPDLAGIVVTVGTDTLEEIAYFLHLTVKDERPVVLVGAMRSPATEGPDGPGNLLHGLRVAGDPASRNRGGLVVLDGRIDSAREVVKTDTERLDAFQAHASGPLGSVDDERVSYVRAMSQRHTARSEFDVEQVTQLPRVDVILTYQGAPGDLLTAAADAGARGIVLAAAGAGTAAVSQREALQGLVRRGVFLVIGSRTGGRVTARTSGTRWLGPMGNGHLVYAEDLAPVKARVLLMLALTRTSDGAEIRRMFSEY